MGTAIMEAISSIFSLIPSIFTEVTKIFGLRARVLNPVRLRLLV